MTIFLKYWKQIGFIFLILSLITSLYWGNIQRQKAIRMASNYESSSDSLKNEKDKNGILQVTRENQTLTISELKKSNNAINIKLLKEAENSEIAKRKIESLSNILSSTVNSFHTIKRDTIIFKDTIPIPMKYIQLTDTWWEFYYLEDTDNINGNVKMISYSDLIVTERWYKEGWWIFRWLKSKKHETTIKDLNPNTIIKNITVVKIK